MRLFRPFINLWRHIIIDTDKDMGGHSLTNLGDLDIGSNRLKTANLLLKEEDAATIAVRDKPDTAYRNVKLQTGKFQSLNAGWSDAYFRTDASGAAYTDFYAYDSTAATYTRVARLGSGAWPQMGFEQGRLYYPLGEDIEGLILTYALIYGS